MKQFFTLTLFVLFILSSAIAQPFIGKQKTIGAKGYDQFSCMDVTTDGGYILGGSSDSKISRTKTDSSRGYYDYWVVKLDSKGNIQWDRTIGGNYGDNLQVVKQTNDGGYILGGYSYSDSSGEKTDKNRSVSDYWIVKLDAAGNKQWDKTIGGNNEDILTAAEQTNDGGYILGGYSFSDSSGEKTQASKSWDYWIVKLDGSGNILWDKTIGGSSADALLTMQQTTDDGYILGGYSLSDISGDKSENSKGSYDYWVVKLNENGNILWDKTIGGNNGDFLSSIQQTVDEGYILAGNSNSDVSGDKSQRNRGGVDYWIVKLDTAGNKQWDKTIGGNNYDEPRSIQQTKDGGYIVGGYSDSNISGEKTEDSRGYYDYWAVKLNKIGNVQWDKTIGGDNTDALFSIKEIARNQYLLGGSSASSKSGEKDKDSKGFTDYWIVSLYYKKPIDQINSATGKSDFTATEKQMVSVYPNPAKDILHIQASGKTVYTLINNGGVTVLTQTISGNGEMNVSRLQAGVYYLKNNSSGEVQKIIIQ